MTETPAPATDPAADSAAVPGIGRLWSVTLDCSDAPALGRFWAGVTGGHVAYSSDAFVGVETPNGTWIGAYQVPDYTEPTWSAVGSTKQFHLDIAVDDFDVAEAALAELGATKADHQPEPDRWRVFLDPAGHPFCITIMSV